MLTEVKHKVDAALAPVVWRGCRRGTEGLSVRDPSPGHTSSYLPPPCSSYTTPHKKSQGTQTQGTRQPAGLKIIFKEERSKTSNTRTDEDWCSECHQTGKERTWQPLKASLRAALRNVTVARFPSCKPWLPAKHQQQRRHPQTAPGKMQKHRKSL